MKQFDFDKITDRSNTMSKKWDVYGDDIIPMWIADTDFACPEEICTAIQQRAAHPIYGYPDNTNTSFEEAVCLWQQKRFGAHFTKDMVAYTPAVVPAIVYAILAFTHEGDHIVVQTPIYHPFNHIIPDNGRHIEANSLVLTDEGKWEIDWQDLEMRLANLRTTMFLLCSPHNPAAKVYTIEELRKIAGLCEKYDVFVVSDEIHSDIVYYGIKHHPFAAVSEWAKDHCLMCVNPSKTFNIAGLRAGAAIIPNSYYRKLYQNRMEALKAGGRNIFGLTGVIAAYRECDYYADQLVEYLQDNLEYLRSFIEEKMPKIKLYEVQATYLLWLDCRLLGLKQNELVDFFLEKAKVALNDGETFGREGTGFMRLNIACPRSQLQEALNRICAAYEKCGF